MRKSLVPEAVENHIAEHLVQQSEPEAGLHAATMHLERAGMCSSPEVGQVLAFLVGLIAAKHVLEIGVFTGYASLKMASALPADGLLIACDISDEWPAIGKPFWAAAGQTLESICGLDRPWKRSAGSATGRSTWPSSTPTNRITRTTSKKCSGSSDPAA